MALNNVTLVSANGILGRRILAALALRAFNVTILARSFSNSWLPDAVKLKYLSIDFAINELFSTLQGQDAAIVAVVRINSGIQARLAKDAVQAGVKRFVPADFGSCDSSSPFALKLMPQYRAKNDVQNHLRQLAGQHEDFFWISLVCVHFVDYLNGGLLQFFPGPLLRKNYRRRIGQVVGNDDRHCFEGRACSLIKPDETKNRSLFIQSFLITQNEILGCLERLTERKWNVEYVTSDKFLFELMLQLDRNPGNHVAREYLVDVIGIVDGNWEEKTRFANELLGLQAEDLKLELKDALTS